jgi:glycosyltransferase involved in cell wall biosynthesis
VKKKILFVMPTMHIGGSVRNFLSLVSLLDPDHYEITLQLFIREGVLLEQIPDYVKVQNFPSLYKDFQMPWHSALPKLVVKNPKAAFMRLCRLFAGWWPAFQRNSSQKEWLFLRHLIPADKQAYDIAVGYLQTVSVYYVVEKVAAGKRIGFVRNEYTVGGYDPDYDDNYFAQLDYIGAVSQTGLIDLQNVFPHHATKVRLIPNVVSPDFCRKMATQEQDPFAGESGHHLVSVGRLVDMKGFDLAVEALELMRSRGYPVIWHVIGSGPERTWLEAQAQSLGVSEWIRFEGEKANPYPYMAAAHVYVQPSRSEGWCISLQEAMVLGRPVVATDFPTAFEQIDHGRTGLICSMNGAEIANAVQSLLDDRALYDQIQENVRTISWNPQEALETFYQIISN